MSTSIRRRLWIGMLGAVAGVAALSGTARAQCNLNTLIGQYLTAANGRLFPPAFGVAEESVSAVAGYSLYNGDGTGSDHITFTINGVVVHGPVPQPFTYTLNPDCTGTKTVTGGPHFAIFAAPNGDALTSVATSPAGFAVAALSQRVQPLGNTQ